MFLGTFFDMSFILLMSRWAEIWFSQYQEDNKEVIRSFMRRDCKKEWRVKKMLKNKLSWRGEEKRGREKKKEWEKKKGKKGRDREGDKERERERVRGNGGGVGKVRQTRFNGGRETRKRSRFWYETVGQSSLKTRLPNVRNAIYVRDSPGSRQQHFENFKFFVYVRTEVFIFSCNGNFPFF